jgi:hypothetical protein
MLASERQTLTAPYPKRHTLGYPKGYAMSFKVHYVVANEAGPIRSAAGGTTFKIGKAGRFAIACNPRLRLDRYHRGTTEPWAVVCDACRATEVFQRNFYERPRIRKPRSQGRCGCGPQRRRKT